MFLPSTTSRAARVAVAGSALLAAFALGAAACQAPESAEAPTTTVTERFRPSDVPTPTTTPPVITAPTTTKPAGPASRVGPGYWLVGTEVQAGRWRPVMPVNLAERSCYLAQTDGADNIIDNEITDVGRPIFTVRNQPGTVFEVSSGCGFVERIG